MSAPGTTTTNLAAGQSLTFNFADCELPGDGSLKSHNWPPDEIQREKIRQTGVDTPFRTSVTMITCVHGTMVPSGPTPQPSTLMIFEYHLYCTKPKHVFDAVDTSFKFDFEAVKHPDKITSEALPNVVAFAPFRLTERFDISTSEIRKKVATEIKAGFTAPGGATIEGGPSREREETHEQKYFSEGKADRDWDVKDKRNYAVWWNVRHNDSQGHGVPPIFRTAILLERANDKPFKAKFTCVVAGGLWFEIKQKILGLVDPDDPINFDPKHPPQGEYKGLEKYINNMEELKDGKKLDSLAYVWGLEPLEPITPSG